MKSRTYVFIVFCLLQASADAQDASVGDGLSHYSEGRYEEAALLFQGALNRDSLNVRAKRFLGYSLQNLDRHDDAIRILSEAAELMHGDVPVRIALARSYEATGQPTRAGILYREAYEIDTSGFLAINGLAQYHFAAREWARAREFLLKLLRKDSTNSLVLLRLGMCEWNLGNLQNAAGILQTANRIAPENAEIVNQLTLLYVLMDLPNSALKVLEAGLKYHSHDARFHKRMADILFKQRAFKESAHSYNASIECGDSTAGTLRSLGAAQFFLEQFDAALVNLRKSSIKDDAEALTPYYLGLVWQKLGQPDSSINSFQKAIILSRARFISDALTHMSVSYEDKKDLVEAVAAIKRALSLTPDNKTLLFYLASLYDRHYADRTTAKKYYEEFVRAAPESEEALVRQAAGRLRVLREEEHFRRK